MHSGSFHQSDVLVIGGGPAGMAAAVAASEGECSVILVDDNPGLGGQIWRGGCPEADIWFQKIRRGNVSVLTGLRVVDQRGPQMLIAEGQETTVLLQYREVVIATGARELFLPFPGWTLPNVMGAGGLQALVKSGLSVEGKRIVVAGTGPLLFAVAAYLRKQEAAVVMIAEQAGRIPLGRFAFSLLQWPVKRKQAFTVWKEISDVPFALNSWPVEAHGDDRLAAITILRRGKKQVISCDYLACGFHLIPNIELAVLLRCEVGDGVVRVNEFQQTSVPGVYCAGEPTMVGGVELSIVEGEIAGLAASKQHERAKKLFDERRAFQKFARVLDRTFKLRPELRGLPDSKTTICRCEDVRFEQLKEFGSSRAAKLFSRCGMGPCQGRICGPAVRFLFDWEADSVRPPIFPAQFANLAVWREPSTRDEIHGTGGK